LSAKERGERGTDRQQIARCEIPRKSLQHTESVY
jgi:hypothetical protein